MIHSGEVAGDPAAFLVGNPDLVEKAYGYHNVFIGTQDFDMMVYESIGASTQRKVYPVSSVLGNLYVNTMYYGVQVGANGRQYAISAYPSPQRANALTEQLRLEPGRDIPKFVHARTGDDVIDLATFAWHMRHGEVPQGSGYSTFRHDRGQDHFPGQLLTPPSIYRQIAAHFHELGPYASRSALEKDVSRYDVLTGRLGDIAEKVGALGYVDEINELPLDKRVEFRNIHWLGLSRSIRSRKAARNILYQTMFEHIQQLQPRIAELQQAEQLQAA